MFQQALTLILFRDRQFVCLFTCLVLLNPPPPKTAKRWISSWISLKRPWNRIANTQPNCEQTLRKLRTHRIMNKRAFLTNRIKQKHCDTNGRRIVIQLGGVHTTFCPEEGILYRYNIAILPQIVGVRCQFDSPEHILSLPSLQKLFDENFMSFWGPIQAENLAGKFWAYKYGPHLRPVIVRPIRGFETKRGWREEVGDQQCPKYSKNCPPELCSPTHTRA